MAPWPTRPRMTTPVASTDAGYHGPDRRQFSITLELHDAKALAFMLQSTLEHLRRVEAELQTWQELFSARCRVIEDRLRQSVNTPP